MISSLTLFYGILLSLPSTSLSGVRLFAEEGDPVDLDCTALEDISERIGQSPDYEAVQVIWRKRLQGSSHPRQVYSFWMTEMLPPAKGYAVDPVSFRLSLKSLDFENSPSVEFSCVAISDRMEIGNIVNLTRLRAPSRASGPFSAYGENLLKEQNSALVDVKEGVATNLTCTFYGAVPRSLVQWILSNENGKALRVINTTFLFPSPDGEGGEIATFQFVPRHKLHQGAMLRCTAENPLMRNSSIQAGATLNILYPPSPPVVSFSPDNVVEHGGDFWVSYGKNLTVTCVTGRVGNPPSKKTISSDNARNVHPYVAVKTFSVTNEMTNNFPGIVYECRVKSPLLPTSLKTRKTVKIAFGPSSPRIEYATADNVLRAGGDVFLLCSSFESEPQARINWTLPYGKTCRRAPPHYQCRYVPGREDFGEKVVCSATNPVSKKTMTADLRLDSLHYPARAVCVRAADKFGVPEIRCEIDRFPKVSSGDLKKMILVTYSEDVKHMINESIRIPAYNTINLPRSRNLFKFVYKIVVTERFVYPKVIVEFQIRQIGAYSMWSVLYHTSFEIRKPEITCGREGCSRKKAMVVSPPPGAAVLWFTSPTGAALLLIMFLIALVLLGILYRFVASRRKAARTNSEDDISRRLGPRGWRPDGSRCSSHSGFCNDSPELGSIISSSASRAMFRAGSGSLPSLHPYSNRQRNFQDLEFHRKQLSLQEKIGDGEYGQVVRALAFDIDGTGTWTDVAVKKVKAEADKHAKEALLAEMSIMRLVAPHENVVRLLGCCIDDDPYFMILEYLPGGNLQDFLRRVGSNRRPAVDPRDLVNFGYEAALGMNHLASFNVVHRDLAARNVLLGADNRHVKIADFGLARDVHGFGIYEQRSEVRLPIRWMAPEFLFQGRSSSASDVWSFGVLLWEIGTLGATPFGQSDTATVMRSVRIGERLDRPSHCSLDFFRVAEECWAEAPEDRPTFANIIGRLNDLRASEDSIDLDDYHDDLYHKLTSTLTDEKF